MHRKIYRFAAACLAMNSIPAAASCGSSSCPLDMAEHAAPQGGHGRVDVSYQFITQDRPLAGSRLVSVGDVPNGEHNEIKTINRIIMTHVDYDLDARWGVGLLLPFISRTHDHQAADTGDIEHWGFTGIGDLSAQARYAILRDAPEAAGTLAVSLTEKFPTGRTHAHNVNEQAEVTIQPGTGSYDTILGALYSRAAGKIPTLDGKTALLPVFIGATYKINTDGSRDYRFANELQVNAGASYPAASWLEVLGQANFRTKGKDAAGRTGEDTSFTGGTNVFLSPGLRVHLTDSLSSYGYVQLPVYQYVNQEQLVSLWNLLVGLTYGFGGRAEGF